MKDKKDKERKSHESTIGKIIYGFLLFMPLFAIGVTCGYAIFNKNAYKSYSGNEYTYTETPITSISQVELYKTYHFSNDYVFTNDVERASGLIGYSNIQNLSYGSVNIALREALENNNAFNFRYDSNHKILDIYNNQTLIQSFNTLTYVLEFDFVLLSHNNNTFATYINFLTIMDIENYSTIDNVFYYAVDKVQQSPLFNWTKNSIIYTGMHNFTTALDITNTFIPLLLTYWLIISVVYFLYDIVLVILVVLHRKIHKMQDSI